MKNIFEKIVKIVTNILMFFVAIIVFFALYNFFVLNILNKPYVNFFGYTFFDVATGSMAEQINIDDVIIVKITKDVKEQDIITYKVGKDFITHRIVKMEQDVIVTKGDANNVSDNPIDKSVVVGKVVKVIPRLGIWKKTLTEPKVLISILVTLTLFSVAFSYKSKDSKTSQNDNKNKINNNRKEEIEYLDESDDIEEL
ncbi:MAG: signal peptidase I [bacterium]|nr:signal peptidase I [bacterium]